VSAALRIAEVAPDGPLTVDERADLVKQEEVVSRGLESFIEVGTALLKIRDDRLYRETHQSFGAYLKDRWDLSPSYASRLIGGSQIAADLLPLGNGPKALSPPTTERQVRAIASVPKDQRAKVWEDAHEIAAADGKSEPTSAHVEAAVAKARGIIPSDAEIVVVETVPDGDEPEPEDGPAAPAELSDADYLASLPVRASLSERCRGWFDAEALAFRHLSDARRTFAHHFSRVKNAAIKQSKGHIGPWLSRVTYALRADDPSRWVACKVCDGTGEVTLIGQCGACKGHGYHIRGGNP
jgi:hypothetical protein